MEIFFRLLFGHFLADFTLQTNYIADWKRREMAGLITHVLLHPVCYVILIFPFLGESWTVYGGVTLTGWSAILIATVLHFIEDWIRITLVNRGWSDNTAFYVWDQIIHILVLWLVSPVRTQPLGEAWPVIGIIFVVVTHFATVTIFFIEKDLVGGDYPETEEKYISILQRMVIWLGFLLPNPLWIFFVAFFLITFGVHIRKKKSDFSMLSVVLGNVIAIACGLFTRFGLNYHF